MQKKFFAVAAFAFAFAFAFTASAVSATEIYTPATGFLKVGSGMGAMAYQAPNVMAAQTALNACTNSNLSVDGKFGPLTKGVFMSFQASKGIKVDGVIGSQTAATLAACSGTSTPSTPSTPSTLGGGEASLEKFDLSSEDDAEEGAEKHVATIEFDVEDGDVMINRVDVSFDSTSVSGSADTKPWKVFETLTLKVDGKEIASEAIDDKDDWLDDEGTTTVFRLSGIDQVFKEGKKVEIEVYLEAQSSVDDAANADWKIFIAENAVRGTDGEGLTQEIGQADDSSPDYVSFSVDEEGGDESIEIKSSSNDPKASTLLVDEDEESEWYEVMIFKLEAEESDIELDSLNLTVTTGTEGYDTVVDDLKIEIDGDEFDDFDATTSNNNDTTALVVFNIDGDATVDADETVEVSVWAKFKQADGTNYATSGETVQVTVTRVDGEGADDVFDTATLNSAEHALSTSTAKITNVSWAKTQSDTVGTLDLFFTVTADEDDFDVLGDDILDSTNGTFVSASGVTTDSGDGQLTRVSGDSVVTLGGNAGFTVADGDTVRFRVRYTTTTAGTHEATVTSVAGQELEDDDQLSPSVTID